MGDEGGLTVIDCDAELFPVLASGSLAAETVADIVIFVTLVTTGAVIWPLPMPQPRKGMMSGIVIVMVLPDSIQVKPSAPPKSGHANATFEGNVSVRTAPWATEFPALYTDTLYWNVAPLRTEFGTPDRNTVISGAEAELAPVPERATEVEVGDALLVRATIPCRRPVVVGAKVTEKPLLRPGPTSKGVAGTLERVKSPAVTVIPCTFRVALPVFVMVKAL